jgi:zinc transport system ATP-binding protein
MAEKVIEIHDLSYKYGDRIALSDINLTIERQEFIGLLGPNGSGKTTLLKVILGLLPVKEGEVFIFDTPLSKFNQWHRIGYVSQKASNFNASFPVSVFEVVAMGLYGRKGLFHKLNAKDKQIIEEALALVGLAGYKGRTIGTLSGGQQQRVFIARALVNQPDLLILDEPTVGIDHKTTNQFYDLLNHLNREHGLTIILVSHDMGIISNKVTNIICLNKKLLYCGAPEFLSEDLGIVNHYHHDHDHHRQVHSVDELGE